MRKFLFPFSLIYAGITASRNFLFDRRIFKPFQFDVLTVGIGNLSVGGTGKSPHVEYLISLLQSEFHIATLSRGYGRKTKGFLISTSETSAREIGDEPAAFKLKYPSMPVAVCENRVLGVVELLSSEPDVDLILLDDVFQHRAILPHIQVLLTAFDSPFYDDFVLPAGNLRELRKGANRADLIVVTKCPENVTLETQQNMVSAIKAYNDKAIVCFSKIIYGELINPFSQEVFCVQSNMSVFAFAGIANPSDFFNELRKRCSVKHIALSDHYNYQKEDLNSFKNMTDATIWICTEKDAVKLFPFKDWFIEAGISLYYLPIKVQFISSDFDHHFFNLIRLSQQTISES